MRLLIISPHFPPTNAADMQRVRLILPYLKEAGIDAEVLGVEAEQVASPRDPWLVPGLPTDVPIHRVRALGLKWDKIPGLGILSFRAMGTLRSKGDELLRRGGFDLVYFSTTQFGVHVLGPYWKKRHGVPFAMDYQDPWVSDYYREHPEVTPPGGRLKYAITSWLSRRDEPRVLRECSGITSVSEAYPKQIAKRYGFSIRESEVGGRKSEFEMYSSAPLNPESCIQNPTHRLRSLIIPFPGDDRDFERVRSEGITQRVFDPADGFRHWVYVGRGGKDMEMAVTGVFRALKQYEAANSSFLKNLRLHFIGTSYAAAGRGVKSIEPIAMEEGLGEIVSEHPDRIPYSETLRCLLDADALVVPGSNDPAYTASKIYPYLLAGKPLLAVFHENSSVVSLIRSVGGGTVIPFATGEDPLSIAERIRAEWLENHQYEQSIRMNREAFAPFTARAQAERLVEFFRSVMRCEGVKV